MFGRSLFALMIVGMGFTILTVTLGPISKQVTELRTDGITETGLACTVGALETSCSVALSNKSAYESSAPNFKVTETSPSSVNRTSSSLLDPSTLENVTISSLSSGQAYVFTIEYFKVNAEVSAATHLDSILKRWNLFIVVGLMGVMVVGIGLSYNYAKA
jgi:hypothetical protein